MSLKEKVENNLTIWLLGTLLTGFLSGIGAYKAVLEIALLKVVSKQEFEKLSSVQTLKIGGSRITSLSPGNTVILKELNIGVKLDADENYNKKTKAARIWFFYPKNPLAMLTEENRSNDDLITNSEYWIDPNMELPINLGDLGSFQVKVSDHKFVTNHSQIQRLTIEVKKN